MGDEADLVGMDCGMTKWIGGIVYMDKDRVEILHPGYPSLRRRGIQGMRSIGYLRAQPKDA